MSGKAFRIKHNIFHTNSNTVVTVKNRAAKRKRTPSMTSQNIAGLHIKNINCCSEHLHNVKLQKVTFRRDMSARTAAVCQESSWTQLELCTLLHQAASLAGLGLWCPSVVRRLTFKLCHFTGPDPAGSPDRLLISFNDRGVSLLLNSQPGRSTEKQTLGS